MKLHGNYVVIVSAGKGTRAKQQNHKFSKQYELLNGKAVLWHAIRCFDCLEKIDGILVVIHADDIDQYKNVTDDQFKKLLPYVIGGDSRQISVFNGLQALESYKPKTVLIHDAARPFCSTSLIERLVDGSKKTDALIPTLSVVDTLKSVVDGIVKETIPRDAFFLAQTPQCFLFDNILEAHRAAAVETSINFTDDASIAEWHGMDVTCIEGEESNFKITTAEDFHRGESLLDKPLQIRVGQGFDVHAFTEGTEIYLCGVKLDFEKSLAGHSDADVGLHAITDALFGALADGDIGTHFPPGDPQWADADSSIFLKYACERLRERSGIISNVDVTLICEAPKIGPHAHAMRTSIADILSIDIEQVSVKATTTERLGFPGRGEGIAALATATIQL